MISTIKNSDQDAVLKLFQTVGAESGYAPMDSAALRTLLFDHPDFQESLTFVLRNEADEVTGFVNGCTGDHIPKGAERGYLTCLLLAKDCDTAENAAALLQALENAFRRLGKTFSAVTFFNPIRLPWVIPGTEGHLHNNTPGVAVDLPLYERMLSCGYGDVTREQAMYLDLSRFTLSPSVEERAAAMAQQGYTVALYDGKRHTGLEEMLEALGNPLWIKEITAACQAGQKVLVALRDTTVAGFAGPVYPEPSGRGYFAGIGVAPDYEGHGLGTLLFHRLCQLEKDCGARYMSLFTGETNPARNIYEKAGFRAVRSFAVMLKEL